MEMIRSQSCQNVFYNLNLTAVPYKISQFLTKLFNLSPFIVFPLNFCGARENVKKVLIFIMYELTLWGI